MRRALILGLALAFVLGLVSYFPHATSTKAAATGLEVLAGQTCSSATFRATFDNVVAGDFYTFSVDWAGDDAPEYVVGDPVTSQVPFATTGNVTIDFTVDLTGFGGADPARAINASSFHWKTPVTADPFIDPTFFQLTYNCSTTPGGGETGDPGTVPGEDPNPEDFDIEGPGDLCRNQYKVDLYEVVQTTNLFATPTGPQLTLKITQGQTWFVVGTDTPGWLKVCIGGPAAYVPAATMRNIPG
jgi:hypothetical protein